MKIAVLGANGPTGRLLTQLALDEHHDIAAFARDPDGFPIEHPRLEVAAGDVHDAAAVAEAITGTDAVLSTLGVPFAKPRSPSTRTGSRTSSPACTPRASSGWRSSAQARSAPHPEPLGGFDFEKIIQPYVVNKLGKTLYDDMRRMEAIVSASDLAWTIVRPSGRFEGPTVTDYGVEIDHIGHRFTARIDLADCLLRQALSDTHARSTIAVATLGAKPSMLKLIWQEGIRKKS
jgi:uncharacterized protein YbjT (DUF2867 family)